MILTPVACTYVEPHKHYDDLHVSIDLLFSRGACPSHLSIDQARLAVTCDITFSITEELHLSKCRNLNLNLNLLITPKSQAGDQSSRSSFSSSPVSAWADHLPCVPLTLSLSHRYHCAFSLSHPDLCPSTAFERCPAHPECLASHIANAGPLST